MTTENKPYRCGLSVFAFGIEYMIGLSAARKGLHRKSDRYKEENYPDKELAKLLQKTWLDGFDSYITEDIEFSSLLEEAGFTSLEEFYSRNTVYSESTIPLIREHLIRIINEKTL